MDERPLRRALENAIFANAAESVTIDDHISQAVSSISGGSTGPEGFTLMSHLLSSDLDSACGGQALKKFLSCKVAVGTSFDLYLKGFSLLVSIVCDQGRELAPTMDMVQTVFCHSVCSTGTVAYTLGDTVMDRQ